MIKKIIAWLEAKEQKFLIQDFNFDVKKANQLLFFLKPEVFFPNSTDAIANSINMSIEKIKEFWGQIDWMMLLNGKVLEDYGIMDRHYGFINMMSKNASKVIEAQDRQKIEELLEIAPWTEYKIYGWHEYLAVSNKFDEVSLDEFWASKKSAKVRGWFYVQKYDIDWELIVFVNAFHPVQLKHYTDHSHYTLLMLVNSDNDWSVLRNDLAWPTFPEKADPNSIRWEFYANKDKYWLPEVNIAYNCMHLSAGPYEAMFELNNFFKWFAEMNFDIVNTNLWDKLLRSGLTSQDVLKTITNPKAEITGKMSDLFWVTEDKDTQEAINIYKEYFN